MTAATRLVAQLLAPLEPQGGTAKLIQHLDQPVTCTICQEQVTVAALADKALGKNLTDRSCFRDPFSPWVCKDCVACISGSPPKTLRQWSIVAIPGATLPRSQEKAIYKEEKDGTRTEVFGQHEGICLTSKANTRPIIDTLLNPPDGEWVVSIAESGQKHVIPYAVVNRGAHGVIRFESTNVIYSRTAWRVVFNSALALRRIGVPAANILEGAPGFIKTREHLDCWVKHRRHLHYWVQSPLLQVALFTITKEIINDTDTYQTR